MSKREDFLSWDEYFMGVAMLASYRSKDPNTQVGACIVNAKNRIMSVGYNGFPMGCSDDEFPWERQGSAYDTKYFYVCHAELNAILNSRDSNLEGCRIYVALFPCNECAKAIIQSGIREVMFLSDKYKDSLNNRESRRMFDAAGVKYTKVKLNRDELKVSFREEDI